MLDDDEDRGFVIDTVSCLLPSTGSRPVNTIPVPEVVPGIVSIGGWIAVGVFVARS